MQKTVSSIFTLHFPCRRCRNGIRKL